MRLKRRKVADNYRHGIDLFHVPGDAKPKQLVLDGKMRPQLREQLHLPFWTE